MTDKLTLEDCVFGWVELLGPTLRDNGDDSYTFINHTKRFGRDGRLIEETENEGTTMYVPPEVKKQGYFQQILAKYRG